MTKESVARILKELRTNAKMTQQQVADAIGRKQTTIASWETGQSQPDADTLFRLCDLYNASVDEAFGYKPKKNIDEMTDEEIDTAIEKEGNEAVELFNQLSPEKQKAALEFLKFLTKS